MHSDRVGKSTGALRKGVYEAQRKMKDVDNQVIGQGFFSINPMLDKYSNMHGKEIEERKLREKQAYMIEPRQTMYMPEKFSQRGVHDCGSIPKSYLNKDNLGNFPSYSPIRMTNQQQESGRSSRLLNKFLNQNDNEELTYVTGQTARKNSNTPEGNPYIKTFNEKLAQRYETDRSQKNNSMISSKSHELVEKLARQDRKLNQDEQSSQTGLPKNKTMTSFTKIFEQGKNNKSSKPNFFINMAENDIRGVVRSTTKTPCTPMKSPNDSHIFMDNGDRSYVQAGANASPAHSAIRFRNTDKSRISALNRSDLSKTSNNNSFLTKRGDDNDFSRVNAQQGESQNRGGMSKTWVKSGLLDSRDDNVSIISKTVRTKTADRSGFEVSDEKSTKKKNLYYEIENMFIKDLHQSSKDSTSSHSRAREYELQKCIGQGAYAKVYKAIHLPTKTKVAIKLYEKSKLTEKLRQKSIKREIKILSRLNHPNIVNFIDCFATKNHIYLVMELVRGLSLYELLKKQPERKIKENNAKTIIKQILKALVYCHSKCATHRDIKLENVIISSNGEVKVIDFGFSTCIPNDKKVKMFCGTPSYMAPEITQKTEYCGPPVDIWATGVLFYVLISGKFPFKGSTDKKLYHRISTNDPIFDAGTSDELQSTILHMMQKSADDRPTAVDLLNSAFFRRKKDASPIKQPTEMFSTLVSMATPRQTNAPSPMKKLPETKYANHKDDRNMVTSPSATLGKTSKVFQEMLTNLGKEKVARQQPSRSPLRDETKRVLNSYYPNNGLLAHGMAERTTANTQKDAWSSRLNRAEENKPRVDQKKTEVRDKSARKTIIGTPSNTISYKEGYKTGWKPSEKPKLSYPLKKPAVDDRLKYDRGEFTRYLDRK